MAQFKKGFKKTPKATAGSVTEVSRGSFPKSPAGPNDSITRRPSNASSPLDKPASSLSFRELKVSKVSSANVTRKTPDQQQLPDDDTVSGASPGPDEEMAGRASVHTSVKSIKVGTKTCTSGASKGPSTRIAELLEHFVYLLSNLHLPVLVRLTAMADSLRGLRMLRIFLAVIMLLAIVGFVLFPDFVTEVSRGSYPMSTHRTISRSIKSGKGPL